MLTHTQLHIGTAHIIDGTTGSSSPVQENPVQTGNADVWSLQNLIVEYLLLRYPEPDLNGTGLFAPVFELLLPLQPGSCN